MIIIIVFILFNFFHLSIYPQYDGVTGKEVILAIYVVKGNRVLVAKILPRSNAYYWIE